MKVLLLCTLAFVLTGCSKSQEGEIVQLTASRSSNVAKYSVRVDRGYLSSVAEVSPDHWHRLRIGDRFDLVKRTTVSKEIKAEKENQ